MTKYKALAQWHMISALDNRGYIIKIQEWDQSTKYGPAIIIYDDFNKDADPNWMIGGCVIQDYFGNETERKSAIRRLTNGNSGPPQDIIDYTITKMERFKNFT